MENLNCGSNDCSTTKKKHQHVLNADFLFVVYAVCAVQVYAAAMMALFA